MDDKFVPHLEILPAPQRRLWDELREVPEEFVLYGGTAIALYLGHRESIDFDFFGTSSFFPDRLYASIPFLDGAEVLQSQPDTLTCLIDRDGPAHVSFFGLPSLGCVAAPQIAPDNNLHIAALIDLAGTKAAAVQHRAEAKDYLDIDAMLEAGVVDLPTALAAAAVIYGRQFNPQTTLKALCYFEDGNVKTLPQVVRSRLSHAVGAVNLSCLPRLEPIRPWAHNGNETRR
ncbi:MAG: nucleotidyl transferase AbiEii/AbiGii toxin family protein [Pseudomonadota bacterium]|nr:nucleotidyl transferase AbiEii/AbiGii toxin family protein [Pseudomonadota bacterium]